MTMLQVNNVTVTFPIRKRSDWPWTPPTPLRAVSDISFSLDEGKTLGIVGESGSGKSTLARAVVGTVKASGGEVMWRGRDIMQMQPGERRECAKEIQMVFQDPLAALNPRMTIGKILGEPLRTHYPGSPRHKRRARVVEMLERVGLLESHINRYPHEFSGGQCQRAAIARALVLKPKLLICDEPVSALDVSVQAQVINLLKEIQRDFGLSIIFIAHDLSVVRHVSDRVAVMYLGRLVEEGPSREIIESPKHPYTKALISSVPVPDPEAERRRAQLVQQALTGEIPSPLAPPSGCVFRTRCSIARPSCADAVPESLQSGDRMVACPFTQDAEKQPAAAE